MQKSSMGVKWGWLYPAFRAELLTGQPGPATPSARWGQAPSITNDTRGSSSRLQRKEGGSTVQSGCVGCHHVYLDEHAQTRNTNRAAERT
jgi:hypothetical protein